MARPLRLEFAGALYHISSRCEDFVEKLQAQIDVYQELSEIPATQKKQCLKR